MGKIVSADGSERQLKGYKRSAPGPGTNTYNKNKSNVSRLPAKVDLRPYMSKVEDQGDTCSCTANATAGAYEYLLKRHRDEEQDVSRLFIYYNARTMANENNIADEGAMISDVIEGLKQYGACTETTWTFDEEYVNTVGAFVPAAAGADDNISEEEIEVIKEYLGPVMEQTGGSRSTAGIIRAAKKLLGDENVLQESKDVIWNHFDYDVLASITKHMEEAVGADGLSRDERKFVDELNAYWQETGEEEDEEETDEKEKEVEEEPSANQEQSGGVLSSFFKSIGL